MVAGRLAEKNGYFYIVLSYNGPDGKRVQKWQGTGLPVKGNKKRAEEMLSELRQSFAPPKVVKTGELSSNMLFSDYMLHWLKIIRSAVQETTWSSYCFNVKDHIVPYFEPTGITLGGLQARHIQSFYLHERKTLKSTSVLRLHANLHKALKQAVKLDLIPGNPVDKVERPKPRKDDAAPEVQALDTAEARRLLQCLSQEPLQWQAIIRLMLDSGCRRGEICGLRWRSVDFINNAITIENNLQYTPEKGIFNTTPKGKKSRTIDIDPEIMSLLRELRSKQRVTTLEGYCFTQHNGEPLHPQTPTRHLHKFGEKYGFPGLHPHQLRHTAATIAITNGADIASVSAKLGHAETATTLNLYTHANQESIKQANEIYRKALYQKEA